MLKQCFSTIPFNEKKINAYQAYLKEIHAYVFVPRYLDISFIDFVFVI